MEIYCYDSIVKIKKEEWDSIVDLDHILNSYNYLKAIESSRISNFRYNYFMFYKDGKLIAHVPVGILTFELDELLTSPLVKKIAHYIKKVFPNFFRVKFIESGFCTALGNALLVAEKKYTREILQQLDMELIKLAKKERTSFILVRDLHTREKEDYDYLLGLKFHLIQNLPNAIFRVHYNSFDDYLGDLLSPVRKRIKKRLRIFEAGCTVREIYDFKAMSPQLLDLWSRTSLHVEEAHRETLNREYFEYLSDLPGTFILLCEKDGKMIGFSLLIEAGNTLISTYCGLDYEFNRSCYTYFVFFYKSIEKAIEMKKKWLDLGFTAYTPKIEVGAIPDPLYAYTKSLNPIVNTVFIPLMRWCFIPQKFELRNIFHHKHYQKLKSLYEKIYVKIEDTVFILREARAERLVMEGDKPIGKKKLNATIFVEDEFAILVRLKMREIAPLNNGKYRMVLEIVKLDNKYLLLWDNLVQCYSSPESDH